MHLSFNALARTLTRSAVPALAPAVTICALLGCSSSDQQSNPFETDRSVAKFAVATAPSYVNTKGDRFALNKSNRTYQWSGFVKVDGIASSSPSDPLPNARSAACRVVEQGGASFTDRRYANGTTLFLDLRPTSVRVEGPIEIAQQTETAVSSIEPGAMGYPRLSSLCLEQFERDRGRELTNLAITEISPERLALRRSVDRYLAAVEDTYFAMSDVETLDVSAAAWPVLVGRAAGSTTHWQLDLTLPRQNGFIVPRNWAQTVEVTFNQRASTILIEMKGRTENLPMCITRSIYQVNRIRLLSSREQNLIAPRATRRVNPSFAIELTEIPEQTSSAESIECAAVRMHKPWHLVNLFENRDVLHIGVTHYSIEVFAPRLDRGTLRLTREVL